MEKVAQHPEHPFRLKLLPQLLGVLGADPSLLSPFFLDVAMPKGPKLHLSRGPVLLPQSKAVLNVSQLCNSHGICCGPFCDCFSVQPLYFCFIDYAKDFDCVDNNKLWKILKER